MVGAATGHQVMHPFAASRARVAARADSADRVLAFDGLRGAACVLVVLSHCWTIVPPDTIARSGAAHGFFLAGNLGVSVFLVLGSFLVIDRLLDRRRGHAVHAIGRFWIRRLLRIGPQLLLLVTVLLAVSLFDRWDDWTRAQTTRSLLGVSTFTLNWSLIDHPLGNRPDVGHLWYLSVEQQAYLVIVPLVLLCCRFRAVLGAVLAAAAVAVMVWRFHVLEVEWWWPASLMTSTRSDGLLLGAAGAVVVSLLGSRQAVARRLTVPCLVVLVVLVLAIPEQGPNAFLEYPGVVAVVVIAVLVVSLAVAGNPLGAAERALSVAPLRLVGRLSFLVYLWHLPVFYASARWMAGWPWQLRAAAAGAAVVVIVAVIERLVERPVARMLRARSEPAVAGAAARSPIVDDGFNEARPTTPAIASADRRR
jgi:peptidoglycan/LPS O-acetylase OafA/YrhL